MRRIRNRFAGLMAAALLTGAFALTHTNSADAQPSPAAAKEAGAAFKAAEKKFNAGDYQGALPLYQKADSVFPGANPKYKIAVCLDKTGKNKEAVAAYKGFAAYVGSADAKVKKKYEPNVNAANKRVEALSATLPATITFAVTPPDAKGVSVVIDGQAAPGATVELQPGQHIVSIAADGYDTWTQTIEVAWGETREVTATLVPTNAGAPAPTVPAPPAAPAPKDGDDEGTDLRVPGFVTLGIAGAGVIAGTIFGISALSSKSDFDDAVAAGGADASIRQGLADDTERSALLSDMSFGVAITFGITGAVLLLSSDHDSTDEASAIPTVLPIVGTQGGGVAATWHF